MTETGVSQAEVDEELLGLPAPPQGMRLLAAGLMALTVVASVGLLASLYPDLRYFFSEREPIALGPVNGLNPADVPTNRYVEIEGAPRLASAVRLTRPFGASHEVFPLAGQSAVFARIPLIRGTATAPGPSFSGRMVTFGQLGPRAASLRRYLAGRLGLPVTSETYLLLVGETPGSDGWMLALALLCLGFIAINGFLAWRWFRPLPRTVGALAPDAQS